MSEQLVIINKPKEVIALTEYLHNFDYVTFDTETTGLDKDAEIIGLSVCAEETKAFYIILAEYDKNQEKLIYLDEVKRETIKLLAYLTTKKLIMHNATYDCSMVENYFKVSLIDSLYADTMVMAHLLDENRKVGLKELSEKLFGTDSTKEQLEMKQSVIDNGGTLTKTNYQMWKADSSLLAKYGAKDALLTFKVFEHLLLDLYEQGLDKFFFEEESMPLLKGPTYQLNTVGLKIDTNQLTQLKKQLEAEIAEAQAFVHKEILNDVKEKYPDTNKKNKFNIGSSSQLAWLLFGQLGLEFGTLTKEGKNVCKHLMGKLPYKPSDKNTFLRLCREQVGSMYAVDGGKPKKIKEPWSYTACDKSLLQKLAPKRKWIEKLLEVQKKTKLLSTYVEGIEERVKYGTIQPQFLQHGTTSGRYSCRNPNFQNLPRDDKRIKKCIVSRPGKVFVGADYSQLEPRVFAYVSQDEALMKAFNGTDDFYSVIGMRVYGKTDCLPLKDGHPDAFGIKYKKLRDLAKVIALASTYGASGPQLAATTGKSIDDTQGDIDAYFTNFPQVAKMMRDSHLMAIKQGFVTNIFGRPRRMPDAKYIPKIYGTDKHAQLPYEARSTLNLSVNHRIQSTGASICNRSLIAFYNNCKKLSINAPIVSQIHDEIIVECDEQDAETVSLLLQDAMENTTTLPGVPLQAVPNIAKNMADLK